MAILLCSAYILYYGVHNNNLHSDHIKKVDITYESSFSVIYFHRVLPEKRDEWRISYPTEKKQKKEERNLQ